jgi:hypothetical protein
MSIRVQELSILQEIAYLDPDLNGKICPMEGYWAGITWRQLRQFFLSPCMLALVVFVALMMAGVLLAD